MNDGKILGQLASPGRCGGEMTFADLLALLVERRRAIAAWTIAGLVLAIAVVLLLPAQWEAKAVVKIGQVGRVGDTGLGEASQRLTEPPARAEERIKLQSFRDAVLSNLQLYDDSEAKGKLYRNSLKVKLGQNKDLLEIKVRGYSREDAQSGARTTVEQLQEIHDTLDQPRIARLKEELEETRSNLASLEADRARLMEATSPKKRTDGRRRFTERVLLASLIRFADAEIRRLREAKMLVEEQLSPGHTHRTVLVGTISVSEEPVFPKKMLVIPLVTLAGLLGGVLVALDRADKRIAS